MSSVCAIIRNELVVDLDLKIFTDQRRLAEIRVNEDCNNKRKYVQTQLRLLNNARDLLDLESDRIESIDLLNQEKQLFGN